eukprot:COSAG05_NODE_1536_length_4611_cov_7.236093_1_plen_180_part_00
MAAHTRTQNYLVRCLAIAFVRLPCVTAIRCSNCVPWCGAHQLLLIDQWGCWLPVSSVSARASFVRCEFDANLALIFNISPPKPARPDQRGDDKALVPAERNVTVAAKALGGALYVSGATLTLVEPRFKSNSNHANCMAPHPKTPSPPPGQQNIQSSQPLRSTLILSIALEPAVSLSVSL